MISFTVVQLLRSSMLIFILNIRLSSSAILRSKYGGFIPMFSMRKLSAINSLPDIYLIISIVVSSIE